MDTVAIGLHRLELAADLDSTERVVRALESEIQEVERWLEEAATNVDDRWMDELEVVEDLLGTACVVLQARITAVISVALKVCKHIAAQNPSNQASAQSKDSLLQLGPHLANGHSHAKAIDACANYFKHREEWPSSWTNGTKQQDKTIKIVRDLKMLPSSTGNLRTALSELGVRRETDLGPLIQTLRTWSNDVHTAVRKWAGK